MPKFELVLTDAHLAFVAENYKPFVGVEAIGKAVADTCTYFDHNIKPEHFKNPMVQALAGAYMFSLLNGSAARDDGLLDMLIPFQRWG